MLKIKISYESDKELLKALELLKPIAKSCRVAKTNTGQYKRAYIKTKED